MRRFSIIIFAAIFIYSFNFTGEAGEDATTEVLKSGLVGAGTGALAAGMTGGKAGKGALIGAGTGIIGNVLLDAITGGSIGGRPRRYEDDYETDDDLDDYYEAPEEDATSKVLKDGIVGAGTGAIAAGVTGGKAGEGALIGAGTGVIGNVLLDTITKPNRERRGRRYRRAGPSGRRKVIRTYDEDGNLVSEEIVPVD